MGNVGLRHDAGGIHLLVPQVQDELRSVLKETAQLTQVLERQLADLRSKGWNTTGGNGPRDGDGRAREPDAFDLGVGATTLSSAQGDASMYGSGARGRRRHSNDDLLVYTRR